MYNQKRMRQLQETYIRTKSGSVSECDAAMAIIGEYSAILHELNKLRKDKIMKKELDVTTKQAIKESLCKVLLLEDELLKLDTFETAITNEDRYDG